MLFLWSSAVYSREFAHFVADGAANTGVLVDQSNPALELGLVFHDDGFLRTFGDAGAATDAFFVVDVGKIVINLYGIVGTDFDAETAADATDFADFAGIGTPFHRVTFDMDYLFLVNKFDDLLRAGENAATTGGAFVFVDDRQVLWPDFYGVEGAGGDARTETHAAVRAEPRAVLQKHGSLAVRNTHVFKFFVFGGIEAVALDESSFYNRLLNFFAGFAQAEQFFDFDTIQR